MAEHGYCTGRDLAERDRKPSYTEWVKWMSVRSVRKGVIERPYTGEIKGRPVKARIEREQWIADCPEGAPTCRGGAMMVDPDEPFFFCLNCGNPSNDHKALPVAFPTPDERREIYAELEKRPLERPAYSTPLLRALHSQNKLPFAARSWEPGETVADLKRQREDASKLKDLRKQADAGDPGARAEAAIIVGRMSAEAKGARP